VFQPKGDQEYQGDQGDHRFTWHPRVYSKTAKTAKTANVSRASRQPLFDCKTNIPGPALKNDGLPGADRAYNAAFTTRGENPFSGRIVAESDAAC